jgi:hypothetical protein
LNISAALFFSYSRSDVNAAFPVFLLAWDANGAFPRFFYYPWDMNAIFRMFFYSHWMLTQLFLCSTSVWMLCLDAAPGLHSGRTSGEDHRDRGGDE